MISNPVIDVVFLLVTVVVAFIVLSFNLQGGLERITKFMMSALLVLMLVLAIHSLFLKGAAEGMTFYLKPDFSKIDGSVVVGAMNQAFFTLSTGMGGMAIFGSYIGKERSLMGEALHVITLDTLWPSSPVSSFSRPASPTVWKSMRDRAFCLIRWLLYLTICPVDGSGDPCSSCL